MAESLYAPDIVSFDLDPPLRYAGLNDKRRAWEEFFAVHAGPIIYEVRELVRWTACFRRLDGVWLVVHDHVSVPADLEHGRAVLNLAPGGRGSARTHS